MLKSRPVKFRNCSICGTSTVTLLEHLKYALFDDSPLSNSCDLVSCDNCGFIYCDTGNTLDDFQRYYAQNLHYMVESLGTGASATKDEERYASILSTVQKYYSNKAAKIIDIGSAKGGLLLFLKTKGYQNLVAIDLLPESIDSVKAKDIEAEVGSVEIIPLESSSADVVVLSHVLEHIVDLQAAMEELCRVVVNGGLVYAEVPSIEYGCSFKNAPMWDFLYEHINYFSAQHLISLFESKDFICLESSMKELHNGNGIIKCACAIFKKEIHTSERKIFYYNINEKVLESFEWLNSSNISKLIKLAEEKTPCYVWGMSAYMQLLIAKTPLGKCNIISFLDKSEYKQTKTINKIPIKSPEILKTLPSETIVIFPAEPYGNSMNKYLKEIDFSGKINVI